MRAEVTLFFDTRRVSAKTGLYSLRLRITHNHKQYHVKLMELSQDDWEKLNRKRLPKVMLQTDQEIRAELNRAREIVKTLKPFSWPAFKRIWERTSIDRSDLIELLDDYRGQLESQERFGTANSFRSTISTIKKYLKANAASLKLPLTSVDEDWLEEFEAWMLNKGKSVTTVGIYARNIRTVFNLEIDSARLDSRFYPFGRNKYVIPNAKTTKKALSDEDLVALFNYKAEFPPQQRALDFWKLIYLCSGINVKDLAFLKYSDISSEEIRFYRNKTKLTAKRELRQISVPLLPEAKELIEKLAVSGFANGGYVFNLIDHAAEPKKQHLQVAQAIKTINKYLDRIRKELGFEFKLRTYEARHTFGSKLYRSNVPIEQIRDAFGHKDLKTTKYYLQGLSLDDRKENQAKLLAF